MPDDIEYRPDDAAARLIHKYSRRGRLERRIRIWRRARRWRYIRLGCTVGFLVGGIAGLIIALLR